VTQIKYLPAGETVGYNRHGVLYRDSKIATIKIGYADGYDRRFGNGVGKMLINGFLVPTIGDICMDMCMLDVTDVEVGEEDEVIVYPDIKSAAKAIGTIPYELLTSISQRVKRVYFYE
jgi:alanine racemase